MSYTGQVVWITGASSGIGEAMAMAFSAQGANVILSGRNLAELDRVATACPGDTLVLPFDTTDLDVLPAMVAQAEGWRGCVDMLVNNAGISQRSLAKDTDFSVYRRIMEVDFFAPVRLTQLVLPAMLARGSGHFINISSVAGKLGSVLRTAYCAAKHALVGYSDAVRGELEHAGIRVTVVTPGFVRTGVARNALNADGSVRGRSDDDIDNAISPAEAVAEIMAAMAAGKREIAVVRGNIGDMLALRASDPERFFDLMAAHGAAMAALTPPGTVWLRRWRQAMRVMVLVKATEDSERGFFRTPATDAALAAMGSFNEALQAAGILLDGDGLTPSSGGKRVAFDGEGRTVIDGPFAPSGELVAGFWLWQVKDMDEAVAWVKRCPNPMPGPSEIEIRPILEFAELP